MGVATASSFFLIFLIYSKFAINMVSLLSRQSSHFSEANFYCVPMKLLNEAGERETSSTSAPTWRAHLHHWMGKWGRLLSLMGVNFRATTVYSYAILHDWNMDREQGNVKWSLATSGLVEVGTAQCFNETH